MRAGQLRQPIIIESRTVTQNSFGEAVESWSTLAHVRADVRPVSGAERFVGASDQEGATVTHRVRLRYRDDVRPHSQRLIYNSRTLDIELAEDPDGRRRELVCVCREVIA